MISCSGTREATVSRCHDRRTGSPQAARTHPRGLLTSDRSPAQFPPTRASMFRSRGCRQTRAWRRRSLGRRRKHGDGTTSDDSTATAAVPDDALVSQLYMSAVVFLPRRSNARVGGGPCATRTLSTRQSTRAEIGTPRAPQQHPCAPHALQEGSARPPLGGRVAVPAPSPGPPLESAEWAVCDQQRQAGRLLGRAIPFFFFPRLVEEGSGISRLTDRVGGWDATAGAADG